MSDSNAAIVISSPVACEDLIDIDMDEVISFSKLYLVNDIVKKKVFIQWLTDQNDLTANVASKQPEDRLQLQQARRPSTPIIDEQINEWKQSHPLYEQEFQSIFQEMKQSLLLCHILNTSPSPANSSRNAGGGATQHCPTVPSATRFRLLSNSLKKL